MPDLTVEEWLQIGWRNGWCSAPVCSVHDGAPTTADEDSEFEDGFDPCVHVVRLFEDDLQRRRVEKNTPHAVWRASNRGWVR